MLSGGNWPLCLYEAVSGRNAGFNRGGDGGEERGGGGGGYDNSHSIQIYGQDRGAPLDACQGTSRTPPLDSGPAKANSRTTPHYSLHPSLFFSSLSLSLVLPVPSYGKVSSFYTAHCVFIFHSALWVNSSYGGMWFSL